MLFVLRERDISGMCWHRDSPIRLLQNLEDFTPHAGNKLLSYIDDLLLAMPSREACLQDTEVLLKFLAENGHKFSCEELQLDKDSVKYL